MSNKKFLTAVKEARLNIEKCKLLLMMEPNTTFFSALLANLNIVTDESVPTAAVDGVTLRMNPYFANEQTLPQLLGLMLHEINHVVYDHVFMYKDNPTLNKKTLNIAQDHYINIRIKTLGYQLPDKGYCDFSYSDLSSMQIYNKLIQDPPEDQDDFTMDVVPAPTENSDEHKETVTSNIIKAVVQAELVKDYGSIPGEVSRRLKDVLHPKLPWHVILQNYMDAYSEEDYSWSRPNKRYQPDFYLPKLHSEGFEQITCGCDVSGSMSPQDLNEIGSELKYIFNNLQPKKLRLMTFDIVTHSNEVFTTGSELTDMKFKGGGGTNVQPLLESIRKEQPEVALVFTDGYFNTPDMSRITSDVIWIIKGNPSFTAPSGVVIPFQ